MLYFHCVNQRRTVALEVYQLERKQGRAQECCRSLVCADKDMDAVRRCLAFMWSWFSMLITQRQLSLAIVGPQNSGKTTLTNIIAGETFEKDTIPTLGVHIRDIKAPHHTNIRIYDLAGQTRFHKLWERCFQQVDLIVYVLDLSDLTNWEESKARLHDVIIATNAECIPMLIVGNKTDLIQTLKHDTNTLENKHDSSSVETTTRRRTWKYVSPLIHNYEFDDIPTYELTQETHHVLCKSEILSKELGIDLKHGLLHLPQDSIVTLNRDIALFAISCKDGSYVQDMLKWILQL